MNYFNCKKAPTESAEQRKATEAQRLNEARQRLTDELAELLELSPEDGVEWIGTRTDLMEAVRIAYEQCSIRSMEGNLCSFGELTERACKCLHVTPPRNPRSCSLRAVRRKGVRSEPLLTRYRWQTELDRNARPLANLVRRPKTVSVCLWQLGFEK